MDQIEYTGPERRRPNLDIPYAGPERRRLDWPFKPLTPEERDQRLPDKSTPGRPDVIP